MAPALHARTTARTIDIAGMNRVRRRRPTLHSVPNQRAHFRGEPKMSQPSSRNVAPDEVAAINAQYKRFIDEEVIPAEPVLNGHDEASAKKLEELKSRAKEIGLWALGHPEEIGGGGLPFLAFAEMNEVIGRAHHGQMAVGSVSMQDSIMLHLYGSEAQKERWLRPLVDGERSTRRSA